MHKDLITIIGENKKIIVNEEASSISAYSMKTNKMLEENRNDTCRLGHKGPFLFVEDVSKNYSSSLENKVYYRCFCLSCCKLDDYNMSRQDRRLLIKIDDIDYSFDSINNIRNKYFELLSLGLSEEESVLRLNEESKNKKLAKVKK